jgi:hypothetical protein
MPKATQISSFAFYDCNKLSTVDLSAVTMIYNNAFQYCYSLTTVNFPNVGTIHSKAFADCNNLQTTNFSAVKTINNNAFEFCRSVQTLSFPVVSKICSAVFSHCTNLISLFLTGSIVCTLSNSNAFTNTPIGGYSSSTGTYGSIYVPASLLTSYQTATNWTYFSSRFVGI